MRSWNNGSAPLPNSGLAFLGALPTLHWMGKESWSYQSYGRVQVRLEMTLAESWHPVFAQAAPTMSTGRKRSAAVVTQQAKLALRHQDIVSHVQLVREGLGTRES